MQGETLHIHQYFTIQGGLQPASFHPFPKTVKHPKPGSIPLDIVLIN
jgi:hypothetical protein